MLKNYLTIAIRNLFRSKETSLINIFGLAIGIASCLLIVLYARFELSYDRFHSNSDNLYRVLTIDEALGVSSNLVGITLPALGPTMKAEIPEVTKSMRMQGAGRSLLDHEEKQLYTENMAYVEPSFFDLFDYKLIEGDTADFNAPRKAVMTEDMAQRMFGSESPMGKLITVNNGNEYEVVGIMENTPPNSHLQFDFIGSMYPTEQDSNLVQFLNSWNSISMVTYVTLNDPNGEQAVKDKMEEIIRQHDVGENFSVTLQKLGDIHLGSNDILFDGYNQNKTDGDYVYTMLIVALFVILIAAFNFMNLSTARSVKRAREVGMRKVLGAVRGQLISQFLGESILLCVVSLIFAMGLVSIFGRFLPLPIEENLLIYLLKDPVMLSGMIGGTLLLGILAGIYPAFMLSNFLPAKVLKGSFATSASGIWLRRVLVVSQFAASIAMIIGTFIIYQQLNHIKNADKGFSTEQIITVQLGDNQLRQNYDALKNELKQNSNILDVATVSSMPGSGFGRNGVRPDGTPEDDIWIVSVMNMDENYFELMDMEIVEGRNYSREFSTDPQEGIIINEAFVREVGWESGVGKILHLGNNQRTVIGVVKDFHFASMRHKIEPLMIFFNPNASGQIALKLDASQMTASLNAVEAAWKKVNPNHPFEYRFFDEDFGRQYQSDENFGKLIVNFTALAILIACLGLFGLSAYTAEQRTKEMGVRKILGASTGNIVGLLSREFALLILIASVIAAPLAWYAMDDWLQDFVYRINIQWWVFIAAAGLALIIAMFTNAYHALRTARHNPAEILRYE